LLDDFDSATVPGLRYVGPILESDTQEEKAATAQVRHPPEPLVLVAFSTTYMDQEPTLGCVIEAMRHLSVQVLVTAGPAVHLASLPPPPM
jgi:UDP:flavonoid glycosyltransferase YjiC (YdhE family)